MYFPDDLGPKPESINGSHGPRDLQEQILEACKVAQLAKANPNDAFVFTKVYCDNNDHNIDITSSYRPARQLRKT